jgi:hypothetical protein
MAELIVEIHDAHRRLPAYRHIVRFPLTIGRGYSNDIILNDPFVAAEHVVLDVAENGWVLRQLDVVNPPQLQGKTIKQEQTVIKSGDELLLGKTLIRFFKPQHAVVPVKKMHDTIAGFLETSGELLAVVVLLLMLLMAQMFSEFLIVSEKISLQKVAANALPVVGVALLWAVIWSMIAFVVRRKTYYLFFLSVTIAYFLADMVLESAIEYVAFNSRHILLPEILSYLTSGVLMVFMFYANMGRAMNLTTRRRILLSNIFSWTLVLMIGFVMQANRPAFIADPEYQAMLKPPFAQWAETLSMQSFLQESDKLFEVVKK